MKKIVAIILLGTLLVLNLNSFALAAQGNTQIVTPYWVNILRINGDLSASGSTGNVSVVITGNSNVTNITATATLYYKNPSNVWVRIPMGWEYSVNTSYLAIDEDFTAVSGTEYKVVLEADVYANGYTETVTREFT